MKFKIYVIFFQTNYNCKVLEMNIKVKLSYCKEVNLKSHHFDILSPMYKDCLYVMSRTIKVLYGKKIAISFQENNGMLRKM